VRLAAKLLGWKVDIKSEEEKRQEVQNAIELLSTGAPVSALIEHGLAEITVDALVKGDIGTVEKLGSMTPEQLEAIEGIDAEAVNRIQQAINSFYGQEYTEVPQEGGPSVQVDAEAPPPEQESEAPPAETASGQSVAEGIESSASDTMVELGELAGGLGAEGHSGTESTEGEITEP